SFSTTFFGVKEHLVPNMMKVKIEFKGAERLKSPRNKQSKHWWCSIREENVETGESSSAALPDDLREYNFRSLPGENSSLGSSDNAASNSELFLQQGEVEKQMDKERQIMQVYFHSSIFHT
ncbi:14729_t:CDS:2, partial [Entrophospora sp. SA101]